MEPPSPQLPSLWGLFLQRPPLIRLTGPVHEEEIDLAWILISVVSIFIFCQSFKIIPDVYEAFTCSAKDASVLCAVKYGPIK